MNQLSLASDTINASSYSDKRLSPSADDPLYLHLADLRTFIGEQAGAIRGGSLLDYGAGSSPYRPLFKVDSYQRADFLPSEDLNYKIGGDSLVPERDGVFDFVLSTQVLEHCQNPSRYLAEALRLLKPGGKLILTTHGSYEDHGCPYDFFRWTADGLRSLVEAAGFSVIEVRKLTAGPRAFFFMLMSQLHVTQLAGASPFSLFLRLFRRILLPLRGWIHRGCDRHFRSFGTKEASEDHGNIYIALAIVAVRPDV